MECNHSIPIGMEALISEAVLFLNRTPIRGHVEDVRSLCSVSPEPEQLEFPSIEDHANIFCPAVDIVKILLQDFTILLINNASNLYKNKRWTSN